MNRYVIAFIIFSFAGWIWESVYCTACQNKWANRGFLYGPVCPIYGCGGVIGLGVFDLVAKGVLPSLSWLAILISGIAVSFVLEYPTSYLLEKIFHARWWDYSRLPLNINGRVSLPTAIGFGLAALLLFNILLPIYESVYKSVPAWISELLSYIFTVIISVDIALTVSALTDFQSRVKAFDDAFQSNMTENVYKMITFKNTLYKKAVDRVVNFKYEKQKSEAARKLKEERFEELIKDYLESSKVKQMDDYIQHGKTTTLEHCENVAWISFLINEKLHLNADEKELVESAILHDFYLYDWHDENSEHKPHGFVHSEIAMNNAKEYFGSSEDVQKSIKSHMWPLNITEIPRSKEALILCVADKYCAIIETLRKNSHSNIHKK